jgi:hypothetical protein
MPATLAELTGPWRPTPLVLDPMIRARAEDVCRRDMSLPPGSQAIVVDARGASVVTLRMSSGGCNSLELMPSGELAGAGGGWSGPGSERPAIRPGADLGPVEQQSVGGGNLRVAGWSIYGQAGAEIATVVVEPPGYGPVQATLTNGWFAAWWPLLPGEPDPNAGPVIGPNGGFPPVVVRGYNAMGAQVDELRP